MSSHHFVKEKQEPALYVDQLSPLDEELLGQLLEWSPVLLVNGNIFEKIDSMGIKVDCVVNPTNAFLQEGTQVLSGKEDPWQLVLDYLTEEKYTTTYVISGEPHLKYLSPNSPPLKVVVYNHKGKTYGISSGFSLWKARGSKLFIVNNTDFETTNLIEKEPGHFEVVQDGLIDFQFNSSSLLITEPL